MTFVRPPGEQHEATVFVPLLAQGAVQRPGPGRPRVRPDRVSGDKGYRSDQIRATARRRGIRLTIPRKANADRTGPFDRTLYRLRRTVEGRLNRCKQYRSLAPRYEKLGDSYRTMGVSVATILWI
jgi:transposase